MKTSKSQPNVPNKIGMTKKSRPEIRDNMDSRQNKERGHSNKQMSNKGDQKKNEN